MRRLLVTMFLIALTFLVFGRSARALDAVTYDPVDDVFDGQTTGPGKLDIVSVAHSNDEATITYTITTKDGFATSDVWSASISMGKLPGVQQGDCLQVEVLAIAHAGPANEVRQCLGSGGAEGEPEIYPPIGPATFVTLGPVMTSHSDGSNTLVISFGIAALRSAGFTGSSYDYYVTLAESPHKHDVVPGEGGEATITHDLTVPATPPPPTPEAPVPTPEPTAETEPTPAPTAAPEIASFAAPEEESTGGFPTAPVAAAGGGVALAGAGLAYLRFRPFGS